MEANRPLPVIVRDAPPDRPFLGMVDGPMRSYGEVHERALRWAGYLESLGVQRGDRVCTMLPVCVEAVEVWLGISWLGALEVPVNSAYRGMMLEHLLTDSGARVAVGDRSSCPLLGDAADTVGVRLDAVVAIDGPVSGGGSQRVVDASVALDAVAPEAREDPRPQDISCILYTSGTTGPSKGVLVPWAQLHATGLGGLPLDLTSERDRFYVPFPLFHVSGKNLVYRAAMSTARAYLKEQFKTDDFWREVRELGCTITLLLGAMANFLYQQPPHADDRDNPLAKITMVPLIADVEAFKERFGLDVVTVFNMTETSCPIVSDGLTLANGTSCGRVRPGYQVRLVDGADREVPDGELGELIVRSDEPWTQMAGYWGRPEATVECWRNQWLHTGDSFVRDEAGNYYFVDRMKDAIRRRGENISSFEVEAYVNENDAVLESAAVAVPSEWGEDEIKIVIVLQPGAGVSAAQLHADFAARMPKFMVPRYIDLVEELPKTPTQKIRKVELKKSGVGPSTWDALAH